jgi:glycosyltransferase involved in cell wall biosynthesis
MLRDVVGHDPRALRVACERADLVTASTPALLKKFAPHGRGMLLRNYLPKKLFRPEDVAKEPHIGWPGAITTHPDDLKVMGNALALLGAPVRLVGGDSGNRAKAVLGVDPVEVTGNIPFDDWMDAVATIHTGVAPLELSGFNIAKSWLKPLEMAAAGVPFVASPTPEYEALGAGLIVRGNKPREWQKALRRLLTEPGLREHEIGRNREVAQKWVMEDHLDEWREAWELN